MPLADDLDVMITELRSSIETMHAKIRELRANIETTRHSVKTATGVLRELEQQRAQEGEAEPAPLNPAVNGGPSTSVPVWRTK
jgi:hypothetical protein